MFIYATGTCQISVEIGFYFLKVSCHHRKFYQNTAGRIFVSNVRMLDVPYAVRGRTGMWDCAG